MRRLKYTVAFIEGGQLHTFTPDDDVPEWAVEKINPDRFEDVDEPAPVAEPVAPAEPKPARKRAAAKPKA